MIPDPPDLPRIEWLARVEVEAGEWEHWSKNRAWRQGGVGRPVHLTKGAAAARGRLCRAIREALRFQELPDGTRWWVALHVRRPSMRADPANALDAVLDATKDAVGVDDRHAAVRSVTWELAPEDPALVVWVGLEPGSKAPRSRRRQPVDDGWTPAGAGARFDDLIVDVERAGRAWRWMLRRLPRGHLLVTGTSTSATRAVAAGKRAAKRWIRVPQLPTAE